MPGLRLHVPSGGPAGVVAILDWADGTDEPATTYVSSGDTPGELAGLVQLVLQDSRECWDDPGLFAAHLVDAVASSGLPYRLSAAEPMFEGRMLQVDPTARSMALVAAGQPARRWRSWSFEELTTSIEWCSAFEAS